jgi:acetyl-CoA acyltransferase
MACISSNVAITSAAEKIMCGDADIVVCGGCETFSDVPIRFSRPIRQRLLGAAKVNHLHDILGYFTVTSFFHPQ